MVEKRRKMGFESNVGDGGYGKGGMVSHYHEHESVDLMLMYVHRHKIDCCRSIPN